MKVETFVEQVRILLEELEATTEQEVPVSKLVGELFGMKEDIENLKEVLDDAEGSIGDAKDYADSATGEIEDASRSAQRAYDNADNAEDELSNARYAMERLADRIRDLEGYVKSLEPEKGTVTEEREDEESEPEDY